MAYYLQSAGKWRPYREAAMDVRTSLPPGNYVVGTDDVGNMLLEPVSAFQLPGKLYGSIQKNTFRIISTFSSRPMSTGVLLAGSKGSGKTLLAKNVCHRLAEANVPTIIVNAPYSGDQFNEFLQRIDQPCAVLFDEFEKVYAKAEHQFGLLTLLDGVFPSKKLFLLTCNDIYRIDGHMKNRPGRLFYSFQFAGLEKEHIEEYCQDNLNDKSQIEAICRISNIFGEFNFDMLVAMVEEMNRYNETPQEVLRVLNILPENDGGARFDVTVVLDGQVYRGPEHFFDDDEYYFGSPVLIDGHDRAFTVAKECVNSAGEATGRRDPYNVYFGARDFVRFDKTDHSFHFERDGVKLILTKSRPVSSFDYRAL